MANNPSIGSWILRERNMEDRRAGSLQRKATEHLAAQAEKAIQERDEALARVRELEAENARLLSDLESWKTEWYTWLESGVM